MSLGVFKLNLIIPYLTHLLVMDIVLEGPTQPFSNRRYRGVPIAKAGFGTISDCHSSVRSIMVSRCSGQELKSRLSG